jgi:hypothetical protein
VGINFSYSTPNIALDGGDFGTIGLGVGEPEIDLLPSVSSTPFFPGATISADLGNGPGITEVATFSVDVEGANGAVAVNNAHGTVTGAAGGVLLRPFARLISSAGDSVSTYGEPWNMN